MPHWLNLEVAARLDEVSRLLQQQRASPFRVEAYRRGADTVRGLSQPVSAILRQAGPDGLERLPAIGQSLARAIRDLVSTGRLPMLERLRGESDAVALLASVPGVGPVLAERLHQDLGIDTLEDLEAAAHDRRLERMPLFGEKRLAAVRQSLASRLGRVRVPPGDEESAAGQPAVAELLDVDHEYRTQAEAGELRRIAPRRFNPAREAWLPILHGRRGEREYTALFSNTARAHELGKTRDWVVIYADGGREERQYTVVTANRGPLKGRRIVRGRETECLELYRARSKRRRRRTPSAI